MTNREFILLSNRVRVIALVTACVGLATACSKKQEAAPAPVKQTYTAPEPELGPLDDIEIDSRVEFPEDRAPQSREAAAAVAGLASAIASGDSARLGDLLAAEFNPVLAELVEDGSWSTSTGEIEVVRVCSLDHNEDRMQLSLAVQDAEGAYLLGWEGTMDSEQWRFEPMAIESQYAMAAIDLDDAPLIGPMIAETEFEVAPEPVEEEKKKTNSRNNSRGRGLGPNR
jgi:hypothetical protein